MRYIGCKESIVISRKRCNVDIILALYIFVSEL